MFNENLNLQGQPQETQEPDFVGVNEELGDEVAKLAGEQEENEERLNAAEQADRA